MRRRRFAAISSPLLLLLALAAFFVVAAPAHAIICIICPPPPVFLIDVNSPSDMLTPGGGTCSLRGAITASNNSNDVVGGCSSVGRLTGEAAAIAFHIGTGVPTIDVGVSLPSIQNKLSINGNSGGATRVELQGPGAGALALEVDNTGAGSSIRNLVINSFGTGLFLYHTSNVTVAGNFIGTNATGNAASANGTGIEIFDAPDVQIGGLSGLTPGGPCTGDCNLISGNTVTGIDYGDSTNGRGVVEGNYVGTDVTGTLSLGNGDGIDLHQAAPTIGGTATGAGNLISGNKYGINVSDAAPLVEGNLIGTNITGTAAIPNQTGIYVERGSDVVPFTIGGSAIGAGNVISGNSGAGVMLLEGAENITFYGNFIGTQPDGTSALPNGGNGIEVNGPIGDAIGGEATGQGNVIAFNAASGIDVIDRYEIAIRGNSIHDNTGNGISLATNQRNTTSTPLITGVNPIVGTACDGCEIDIFSDADGQGKVFEGTVTADSLGNWTFDGSAVGPDVTATATSGVGSTSEFSSPFVLPVTPTPTPSSSPSPTPTETPSPSVTVTPTATPSGTTSPTPTFTPTPTPLPSGSAQYRGDANCDGHVNQDDALAILQSVAGVQSTAHCLLLGEVDCDHAVGADDALRILAFASGAPLPQPSRCPAVGTLT